MAGRGDRWDRERFHPEAGNTRFDERSRYDDDDGVRSYTRRASPPLRFRDDERRRSAFDDDFVRRERRYHDDEPRSARRPPSPRREEYERRVMMEKELGSPSPRRPQRPGTLLRRQSSLDTFDRRPRGFHDHVEQYGPPARREDYRPDPYAPIPLPRTRALPPPRRYESDEIRVSDPDYYGDDAFHAYPERTVREREVVRTRRRERSHSRTRSHRNHSPTRSHRSSTIRSSSRSSSTSSSSSSRTATTVKSEYPKKGKTRIPAKLVSKRAIIELGYPFEEEGNTIIIQRALGQENIDDLLRLSEEYKKCEVEISAARSEVGEVIEERRREEVWVTSPPPPPPAPVVVPMPMPVAVPPPPSVVYREEPAPYIVNAAPPPPPPAPVAPAVMNTTTTMVVRDTSPTRSTASYSSYTTDSTWGPVIVDAGPRGYREYREVSEEMSVGPVALMDRKHRRHRSHSHSRGDLVRAERLSDGQLVIYEERVEKVEEPRRGVRIEKDKKGPPPMLLRAMLATLT
ncbi:hypothetical protein RB601_003232 [Gaeumannomyces tritici]